MWANLRTMPHAQRVALWDNRRAILNGLLQESEPLDSEMLGDYVMLLREREVRHG